MRTKIRLAPDHDVFGWTPSKDMNVIDSKMIEHDVVRKPVPTFRHHALDHDVFGWTPSKDMNVIDSKMIEHDVVRKPVPTFRHHALAALAMMTALGGAAEAAEAEAAPRPYLDLPITQRTLRDGVIRYGVWVKVGERSVEAMLDTGSTGLRVLPSVFTSPVTGVPTDVTFRAGLHMEGRAVVAPIEIGSMKGMGQIEVVKNIACVTDRPDCGISIPGVDSFLIGGDGYPSEGYSAILGIGLPFDATDIGNPLSALGVGHWIVSLPRPYERAEGHLILDPDDQVRAGFTMLARHGSADADGCLEGGSLREKKCGTVLFDTGTPAIDVSADGVKDPSAWDQGAVGALSFKVANADPLKLDVTAGVDEGVSAVTLSPPKRRDQADDFILAGLNPYFTYDILYDEAAHTVGLRKREPRHGFGDGEAADATTPPPAGTLAPRRKTHRRSQKALVEAVR